MSFFKKIGHSFANIGRKTGSGISQTFKKAGKNIARGLGSVAGGLSGAEIGGAVAGLLGPEAIPVGMLIGGLAGKELGKEGAGVAYKSLEKQRPQGTPAVQGAFQGPGGKTGQRGRMSIPDSKYFRQPPRLGMDGAGQRQNPIEKARPSEKKMDMFV